MFLSGRLCKYAKCISDGQCYLWSPKSLYEIDKVSIRVRLERVQVNRTISGANALPPRSQPWLHTSVHLHRELRFLKTILKRSMWRLNLYCFVYLDLLSAVQSVELGEVSLSEMCLQSFYWMFSAVFQVEKEAVGSTCCSRDYSAAQLSLTKVHL